MLCMFGNNRNCFKKQVFDKANTSSVRFGYFFIDFESETKQDCSYQGKALTVQSTT